MSRVKYDPTGLRLGRLQVIRFAGNDRNRCSTWLCQCDCGTKVIVYGSDLRKGHTQSCGCLRNERVRVANTTHGRSSSPLYRVWCNMRQRCENPDNSDYKYYGARGIRVCDRWQDFTLFEKDVGVRPSRRHSIDRYPDPNGPYAPDNFRWATQVQQVNNLAVPRARYKGKTQVEWAKELGVDQALISRRLRKYGNPYGRKSC